MLQRRQLALRRSARPSTVVIEAPSACTASRQQLLTAAPVELHGAGAAAAGVAADVGAGEIEVVAEEVDEQPRARDVALVGRAVDLDRDRPARGRGRGHAHPFALSAALQNGAHRRDLGEVPAVVGARVDVGRAGRAIAPRPRGGGAHGRLGQSPAARLLLHRGRPHRARTTTQPIATLTPSGPTVAAALTMYVPCAPSATPAIASPVPGFRVGTEIFVSSSPSRDGRQVDAEEELLGRDRALAVGALDRERRAERGEQRRKVVRRVVDADVAADRAAVADLDVGDRRGDLGEDRPRDLDLGRRDRSGCSSPSRRSRASTRSAENEIVRSSARSARSTSTSGEAARAFITLTSVCPPARARAPSCSERRAIASSTVAGRAYSTSRRSMARLAPHRSVTCQETTLPYGYGQRRQKRPRRAAATAVTVGRGDDVRRGLRRLGDQLSRRCGAAGSGRVVGLRARARRTSAGGCIRTSSELTLPGFTHEVMASWHPLFTGSAAYAELKDELDRRGVEYINTDLPTGSAFPDGSAAFIAARSRRTSPSWTGSLLATAPPGSASSTGSWQMPISRSACSARSCGRAPASDSGVRRTGASGGAGSCSSPAVRSSAAVTGSPRRSSRKRREAFWRLGCCTRASARIRRAPGS